MRDVEEIGRAFEELLAVIALLVKEGTSNASLVADQEVRQRWKADEYQETTIGITIGRCHLEEFRKSNWLRASVSILEKIKAAPEYDKVITVLRGLSNNEKELQHAVEASTRLLLVDRLEGRKRNLCEFTNRLVADLGGEPAKVWSEIGFHGFAIQTKEISFLVGQNRYTFRQCGLEDYQAELGDFESPFKIMGEMPVSFLLVEKSEGDAAELQREAWRAEALLRLFGVCSASFDGQTFYSDTICRGFMGGRSRSNNRKRGPVTFELRPENNETLGRYWAECLEKIPKNFYDISAVYEEDFLRIAYARYTDALFHNFPDGRIAFAVMGLEALFLGRDEQQELKYRLSLRIAKLFSKLGVNVAEAKARSRAGYDIRSVYVHGGHFSKSELGKFEKKMGLTLSDLSHALMNYLRVAILIIMVSKTTKEELFGMIENSLFSNDADRALEEFLKRHSALVANVTVGVCHSGSSCAVS